MMVSWALKVGWWPNNHGVLATIFVKFLSNLEACQYLRKLESLSKNTTTCCSRKSLSKTLFQRNALICCCWWIQFWWRTHLGGLFSETNTHDSKRPCMHNLCCKELWILMLNICVTEVLNLNAGMPILYRLHGDEYDHWSDNDQGGVVDISDCAKELKFGLSVGVVRVIMSRFPCCAFHICNFDICHDKYKYKTMEIRVRI